MALESSSTLQQTDEVAAAAGGGGAVGGGGGVSKHRLELTGVTTGTAKSTSTQSNNSSQLQSFVDEISGGNRVGQLPSGVIEHDQPIHFYPDGSNSFDQYGKFRLEGVTDYSRSSANLQGTTLKYTGDPSLTPYQFGGGVFESQRYRVNGLNFVGTTNTNVPLVKVQSTFQRSEFTDLYVQQEGDGHGMIARDCWVSNFERIFCIRPNSSQPQLTGIGFQFHNRDFFAGNTKVSRVTGSGFRYGTVIGGLEYGEGSGQVTTKTEHLQGQNCYVGVVFGFGAGGYSSNLYAEGCTKASYWILNRTGVKVNSLYSFIGADGKSNIQLGMSRGSGGGSPEMPYTGTASDDVAGALRDTSTDFATPAKGTAIGDPVYNTTGSKPYPRAFITEIKTERQLGNGASGEVHQLGLTDDIFDAGDSYAIAWDLDDYTCTASQEDSEGKYDGETKPTAIQAAVRGVDIRRAGFAPYRDVGVLYRASGETRGVRVEGANGSQKNGGVTSVSANRLIDSSADFTGGFYSVHIGDNVVNRDTGEETTVTDVISSTELALNDDIFTSTDHTYAVSGATIVVNSTVQDLGVSFSNIANRFGVSESILSPDYVGQASSEDPSLPDRQLAPTSREGVAYEEPERWAAGTHTIPKSPNRTWEQATLHVLLPITGDTTLELPPPDDPEVQNRVLQFFRTEEDPNNTTGTITDPSQDIQGVQVDPSGDLTLAPGEGVYMHATEVSGNWTWTVIESGTGVQSNGVSVLPSASDINYTKAIKARDSGAGVAEVKLALPVKRNGTEVVPEASQISFDGTYFDVKQNSNNQFRPDISFKRATLVNGGAQEIDAAELSGDAGTNGQVLETDGSSAQWTSIEGKSESAVGLSNTIARGRWDGSAFNLHHDDYGDLSFSTGTSPAEVIISSINTVTTNANTQVMVTPEQADVVAEITSNENIRVYDAGSNGYSELRFWFKLVTY